jgi:hypothetical protein
MRTNSFFKDNSGNLFFKAHLKPEFQSIQIDRYSSRWMPSQCFSFFSYFFLLRIPNIVRTGHPFLLFRHSREEKKNTHQSLQRVTGRSGSDCWNPPPPPPPPPPVFCRRNFAPCLSSPSTSHNVEGGDHQIATLPEIREKRSTGKPARIAIFLTVAVIALQPKCDHYNTVLIIFL